MRVALITGSCGLVGSESSIFFSQKGKWNIQTDNSSFELDYKDTFSVPVGSNISIKIEEKNESLLNCVSQI